MGGKIIVYYHVDTIKRGYFGALDAILGTIWAIWST